MRKLPFALALVVGLWLLFSATASAGTLQVVLQGAGASPADTTVDVPFPTAGDSYCAAVNGCGTIPAGGQTTYMWTAGDWVESAIFTLPTNSVTDLTANWTFQDFLGDGNTETWDVLVNDVLVAIAILPDCDFCGSYYTVTGTVTFPGIAPVNGGYQIALVLENTVPGGEGSIAWTDGGTTGLSYGVGTPEPGSLALVGSGILLLAGLLRRKLG